MSVNSTGSEQVTATARHVLQCTNGEAVASLESPFKLGPMDHLVFPFVPIEAVFVYKQPKPTSNQNSNGELIAVGRLKQTLSRLLEYYPHLTGRLQFDPDEKPQRLLD